MYEDMQVSSAFLTAIACELFFEDTRIASVALTKGRQGGLKPPLILESGGIAPPHNS